MSRKNSQPKPNSGAIPDNWNNPFVGHKLDLPEPPKPAPPTPPPTTNAPKKELSPEDQALLKAFGGDQSYGHDSPRSSATAPAGRGRVTFNIQRKGKGGKTVTKVFGLQDLDLPEQMELCTAAKNALGCGARFLDGILEIQGDQRDRAAKWLASRGFHCQ